MAKRKMLFPEVYFDFARMVGPNKLLKVQVTYGHYWRGRDSITVHNGLLFKGSIVVTSHSEKKRWNYFTRNIKASAGASDKPER